MSSKWERWMGSFNLTPAELSLKDDKALYLGEAKAIWYAFHWSDTKQGSHMWSQVAEFGHTPESWMILMDMVRRYKEYKGIKDAHNPEHK